MFAAIRGERGLDRKVELARVDKWLRAVVYLLLSFRLGAGTSTGRIADQKQVTVR
jgi:hypothetical protein